MKYIVIDWATKTYFNHRFRTAKAAQKIADKWAKIRPGPGGIAARFSVINDRDVGKFTESIPGETADSFGAEL